MQENLKNRTIYCRDNLEILQGMNTQSIDLIYLDPPFNKKKVFTAPIGSSAKGASFKDWFQEEDLKNEWIETIKEDHIELYNYLSFMKRMGQGRYHLYNYCYLCYMAIRLLEMHRILKGTGSLYFHCDQTMSHFIKLLLDLIFGEENFRNEIIWCYHGPGSPKMRQFNRKTDSIFWYSKGETWIFNSDEVRVPFKDPKQTLRKAMSTSGSFTQDEVDAYREKGKIPENWWELRIAARSKKEYVGYPTQKPVALLERIIRASSRAGDIVLDPFCGCATTCIAAEGLDRKWIGIDTSMKAYELVKQRLTEEVANPEDLLKYGKEITFSTVIPERTDREGYEGVKKSIYILSNPAFQKMYKVGIAKDCEGRLNSYQTSDPDRGYKIEYQIETCGFREIERHIHKKFKSQHEWIRAGLGEIREEIRIQIDRRAGRN